MDAGGGQGGGRGEARGEARGGVRERIERILRERFQPLHLELHDESARHAGHAGAAGGGGHFDVTIVSAAFEGLSLIDQHRLVNEALRDLIGGEVHALAIRTSAPSRWMDGLSSKTQRP